MTADDWTFGLAVIGYGLLGADLACQHAQRPNRALSAAVASVVGVHVALVWHFRFDWSLSTMLEKSLLGALLFHSALLLIVLEPQKRTLEYVNAGHPGLVVCQEGGNQVLEKTGMVLGVVGDQQYEASPTISLEAGDVLFLHTDGVDEAMSPERAVFGLDRLHKLVGDQRRKGASANEVLAEVERQIRTHVGSDLRADDFTMIAVKLT